MLLQKPATDCKIRPGRHSPTNIERPIMTEHLFTSITSIALAVVGLALVATIVGKNSQTGNVISAAGGALARDIGAAVAPVTGGGITGGLTSFGGFTNYSGY